MNGSDHVCPLFFISLWDAEDRWCPINFILMTVLILDLVGVDDGDFSELIDYPDNFTWKAYFDWSFFFGKDWLFPLRIGLYISSHQLGNHLNS